MNENEKTALVKLGQARKLLEEAKTCDEVKKIRNGAEALRTYSQQQKLSLECYNYAAEIKLRAERRMGWFLAAMEKNRGGHHTHRNGTGRGASTSAPTLQELNIGKEESARYQKLSQLPEGRFNQIVAETNAASQRLTTQRILRELGLGNGSKRDKSAANTTSPEGTVIVAVNVVIKKEREKMFLNAIKSLGDKVNELIFNCVIMMAAKRRRKNETHHAKPHIELVQ